MISILKHSSPIILILILFIMGLIWFLDERAESFSEPHEALLHWDERVVLIPAVQVNNEALYFFIKNDHLGVSVVTKGILGWKAGVRTFSPMKHGSSSSISGIQGQGGNLIYGLISSNHHVEVNGILAPQLDLNIMLEPKIIKASNLEEQSLWYFLSDTQLAGSELILVDSNTNEVLDIQIN